MRTATAPCFSGSRCVGNETPFHDHSWIRKCSGTLPGKKRELELALEGTFTKEQRWLLGEGTTPSRVAGDAGPSVLEQEIERRVAQFDERMRRLLTVPGIDRKTAWTIVAAIGVDLSAS